METAISPSSLTSLSRRRRVRLGRAGMAALVLFASGFVAVRPSAAQPESSRATTSAPAPPAPPPTYVDDPQADGDSDPIAYALAGGGILANNITIWAFSRYVTGKRWAQISPESIAQNLGGGLALDDDDIRENFLGHPIHGALHYQIGRLAGLSFAPSSALTFLGTLQWEFFMENTPPSANDIVTTTLGGIFLGEMMTRVADLLLDEGSHGVKRGSREIAATAVAPLYSLGRGARGDWMRDELSPIAAPVRFTLQGGLWGTRVEPSRARSLGAMLGLRLAYSDVARVTGRDPLEHFSVVAQMTPAPWMERARFLAEGELWGARFGILGGDDALVAAMMDYGYSASPLLRVGGTGIGAGVYLTEYPGRSDRLDVSARLVGRPLNAISTSETSSRGLVRDYAFGTGASAKILLDYRNAPLTLYADLNETWLEIVSEHGGEAVAGTHRLGLEIDLVSGLSVTATAEVLSKRSLLAMIVGPSDLPVSYSCQAFLGWSGQWRGATSGIH